MRTVKTLMIILFAAFIVSCAQSSQISDTNTSMDNHSPAAGNVEEDFSTMLTEAMRSNITRVELDNGMIVILREKHDNPIVHFQMWVRAGSVTEGEFMGGGISHFNEHMLFKGTNTRGVGELPQEIREAGGNDFNAFTSYEKTVYHFTVQKDRFDTGLDVLADAGMNSAIDPEAFANEKLVITREINMTDDDPDRQLWYQFVRTIFKVHPYKHPVIGYRNVFEAISRDDLYTYYKRMYIPNNMVFVVVGDFETEEALEKIRTRFSEFERGTDPIYEIPEEPPQIGLRISDSESFVNNARVSMGYPACSMRDQDTYALDVLALIAGSGRTSRLYRTIKEEQELVYSIDAFSWTPMDAGAFMVDFETDPEKVQETIMAVVQELTKFKTTPVSQEELDTAKSKVVMAFIMSNQSVEGIATTLGSDEITAFDYMYSQRYIDRIRAITPQDIMYVANKYFSVNKLNIAIQRPEGSTPPVMTEETLSANLSLAESVSKQELDNGAILLLKEDNNQPIVELRILLNGGYRFENLENNGIANLMCGTILKGTENYTSDEIASIIELHGGSLYYSSGKDAVSIGATFLSDHTDIFMDLLEETLIRATFPQEEIDKNKDVILSDIRSLYDDIWSASRLELRKIRYGDHPYSMNSIGNEESVQNITRDQLLSLYNDTFTPSNMVISVFGDINSDDIKARISIILSQLGEPDTRYWESPEPVPPITSLVNEAFYMENARTQSIVKLVFDAPNMYSEERYSLNVLSEVLSGLGGRLFVDARDNQSLAYAIGGYFLPNIEDGWFMFYAGTEKELIDAVIETIHRNIQLVLTTPISEEEINIAKGSIIGSYYQGYQTLGAQASSLGMLELMGMGYETAFSYVDEIEAVTAQDIQEAARQVFETENYIVHVTESED